MFPSRIALRFYLRKIIINNKAKLQEQGPLLIAANHPNSFLDAIIVSTLFKSPVYSLTRGDAFAGKWITKILSSLNMLPIFRLSEGAENLEHNYTTFDACQKLFEQNKIVLIFSEGRCINEWHLRSLKKGTARLAMAVWQTNVPLKILPLGLNYSSFRHFGKTVICNFGEIFSKNDFDEYLSPGKTINEFNEKLKSQLQNLVYEIDENDFSRQKKYFAIRSSLLKKIFLFIPAITGFILNSPLYFCLHLIIKNRAEDHYDSIMMGLLFLIYPLYIFLATLSIFFITNDAFSFSLLFIFPFSAYCLLHFKNTVYAKATF